ncbi:hypothetical protein CCZ01_09495 [Helicobacter monodelphidis]|uniref:DUF2339 domain-containing protein n=1 Tax=Helicobacter sp. 15-1451 TaxID=2004995 RepID=UPI000DCB9397|nr:DUF2339 domain-containing protein [Helicobacter sp. 15-1451]RAX56450.1 hypothetical protein CCZ01_09495 [Helicobacter sp. 15-1451]
MSFIIEVFLAVGSILAFVNFFKVKHLQKQIQVLKQELHKQSSSSYRPIQNLKIQDSAKTRQEAFKEQFRQHLNSKTFTPKNPQQNTDSQSKQNTTPKNFERFFTQKIFAIIGGIFLILATFFLIQYSLTHQILTPKMRIGLAIFSGFCLLVVGNILFHKYSQQTSLQRIAQILIGSAFVILFLSFYGGYRIYGFFGVENSFLILALIAMCSLVASVYYGILVGFFGLIGGMITPTLFAENTDYNPYFIFGYIFLFYLISIFLHFKKGYKNIHLVSILFVFLYILHFILFYAVDFNSHLVLALCILLIINSIGFRNNNDIEQISILSISYFLFTFLLLNVNIQALEWGILGILIFISALLTFIRYHSHKQISPLLLSLLSTFTILISVNQYEYVFTPYLCFFGLYLAITLYCLYFGLAFTIVFCILAGFYLCGILCFEYSDMNIFITICIFLFCLLAYFSMVKQKVQIGIFPTLFFALGILTLTHTLYLLLPESTRYIGYLLESALILLSLSLIQKKPSLPQIWKSEFLFLCVFMFILLPLGNNFIQMLFFSLFDLQYSPYLPWKYLFAYLLAMGYYLFFFPFDKNTNSLGLFLWFLISGLTLLLLIGLVEKIILTFCYSFIYLKYSINVIAFAILSILSLKCKKLSNYVTIIFALKALYDLIIFVSILYNPLFQELYILKYPKLEPLLMIICGFFIPTFLLWLAYIHIQTRKIHTPFIHLLQTAIFCYGLLSILILIRYLFWYQTFQDSVFIGEALWYGGISTFENYIYTLTLAILATTTFLLSPIFKIHILRIYSLILFVGLILKLFFVDANSVEGIAKILLFLTMGLLLLIISYLYSKYIFKSKI